MASLALSIGLMSCLKRREETVVPSFPLAVDEHGQVVGGVNRLAKDTGDVAGIALTSHSHMPAPI